VALCCIFLSAVRALAEEDMAPATAGAEEGKKRSFSTGTAFFDDAALSGGVYYFQRDRRRWDPERKRWTNNLNHATLTANADFSSGFIGGVLGMDVAVFGTHDIKSTGAPDHEMNFMPWGDPWHPDWNRTRTKDGVSVYKAHVKGRVGPFWAKAGYFQPSGPGVLGVNWSIMPGTYRGVNAGADIGGLSVALAWADAYKAPWYKEMNNFYKNDGETHVPWVWSSGARYSFACGLTLEAAYGQSKDHLWNGHFKSRWERNLDEDGSRKLAVAYQLYMMGDNDNSGRTPNDNFDGVARQHYALLEYSMDYWNFKLEGTYTRASVNNPEQQGQFAYRLTDGYGSSNGAYDIWWDAHTDWNAHNEKAVFGVISRGLDDLLPVAGFTVALGSGIGWDGEAYGVSRHLKEWAFTFDVSYVQPDGPLKGAFVKIHLTDYHNGTNFPSWDPYKNGFQSERDIRFFAGIPFDL
jgi:hypothetical protein